MQNKKIITNLVFLIVLFASAATVAGIFSTGGSGEYEYRSIRGQTVTIHGDGLYQDMSADVAIQGIAQDCVTLFIAIPFLLVALYRFRVQSLTGKFLLAGVLSYFFLTYLFYMNMAMYNVMFLVYVALTGFSFFAFLLTLLSIETDQLPAIFSEKAPVKFAGGFLILNAIIITLLWLRVVVPPLLDRTIIPLEVEHYTTLTVQAFDLSLFLPFSIVAGLLLIRKSKYGYLFAPVYLVFLSLLMLALIAKLIAMSMDGQNVIPAIFLIPAIALVAIVCTTILLRNINTHHHV
jgi:hypothetical protein